MKGIKISKSSWILGLVFVVFLLLKLSGYGAVARWNWWMVTAPVWVPVALVIAATFVGVFGKIIYDSFFRR